MGVQQINTNSSNVRTQTEVSNATSSLVSSGSKNAINTGLVTSSEQKARSNVDSILAGNRNSVVAKSRKTASSTQVGSVLPRDVVQEFNGSVENACSDIGKVNNGATQYNGGVKGVANSVMQSFGINSDNVPYTRDRDFGKQAAQNNLEVASNMSANAVNKIKSFAKTSKELKNINTAQQQINKTFGDVNNLRKGSNLRKDLKYGKTKRIAKNTLKDKKKYASNKLNSVAVKIEQEDDFVGYNLKAARVGGGIVTKKSGRVLKSSIKELNRKRRQRKVVKSSEKAAQAAARTARTGAKAAAKAGQAAAKGGRAAAKGAAAGAKGAAAGVKGLGAAIAAGGWIPLVIIAAVIVLLLVIGALTSIFGNGSKNVGALTGNDAIIAQTLLDKGFDKQHVAAILGNTKLESGGANDPTQCEFGRTSYPDDKCEDLPQCDWTGYWGYGICQWTSAGRKSNVCSYCKNTKGKTGDCAGQAEFLADELSGQSVWSARTFYVDSPVSYAEWLLNTDVAFLTKQFCICFEGPSSSAYNSSIQKRIDYANQYYAQLMQEGGGEGTDAVSRAYAELGKPYVWGACGPDGYDCSGLVSYCISGEHIRLGTTYDFMNWNRVLAPYPGCVCTSQEHCGIYIGDGNMIHAPQTGDVVKISPVQLGMIYVSPP